MPRGHGGAGATGAVPTLPATLVYKLIYLCRNEDNAPRARRRRRYGRGPTLPATLIYKLIYICVCRNEDNAPRARRRRRYGRGPNKYTRNWEDEEAYAKTLATRGTLFRYPSGIRWTQYCAVCTYAREISY